MDSSKIIFNDCEKHFTIDLDKAISPKQTVENFREKLKNINLDILSEVKRIDNGRLDIPVYFSVCGKDARHVIGTKKQMGKGASPEQAMASACMELGERFSFFSFKNNTNNFLTGDYRTMREQGYSLMHPQYLLKSVHDASLDAVTFEKLLEGVEMQWCWGTNITTNESVLLPFSWFFAINEFNGPSAGNTLEEAAIQGISEIIERHVCSRISREKTTVPEIDKTTIQDPVCRQLLEKFKSNGVNIKVYDFSLDTGMCTVAALAWDPATFPESSEIVYTAGTTPGPEKAIIRAITEVAQLAGDFNSHANYEASGLPKPQSLDEMSYLLQGDQKKRSTEQMYDVSDRNIRKEIQNCIEVLQEIDMDVFVVDITHENLKIPALYTIIPGAHFRERASVKSAGLFAAKLVVNMIDDPERLEERLERMATLLPDAYYLDFFRGKNLFNCGRFDQAIIYFAMALRKSPEKEDIASICSYYGNALLNLNRYDEAINILDTGKGMDAFREDIHNLLGVCFFKKENYKEAIECFKKAVEINPSSAMDYANLGVNYAKLGQNEEAVRFFTLALTLDPSLDFAKDYLENILQEQQRR